ncbi:MAG: hypothetical protein GX829_08110 [Clostridium sp.]|nr:hypothetical protein [Clostridium sp.]
MENFFPILIGTILINNLALTKLVSVGQLTTFGENEDQTVALGLSAAVIMGISSILSYFAFTLIIEPFELFALDILLYVLIVLAVTGLVMVAMKKIRVAMFEALKKVLPLLAINSAVMYLILDNAASGLEIVPMLLTSVGAPLGLLFAFVLYGAVKERLAVANTPKAFKGLPILLIYAALAVMAMSGLNGIL